MTNNFLLSPEFQMSLLLFAAMAGYLIAYGINSSAIVGIILVGIIVGPSVLGLVTYTDFVSSVAHLGAVVLLFTIGLEFKLQQILNWKYGVIALLGIIFPWIAGYFIAISFSYDFNSAVFIGTAVTATSIAITANALGEMGKLQTRVARAIMGAAIIDDILALLTLSISEQFVTGSLDPLNVLIGLGKALGFIFIVAFPLRIGLQRVMQWFDKTRIALKFKDTIFIFAMMIAFLYSIGADFVGLSAVVGSFLAGVTFASLNLEQGEIFRKGSEHLKIIFASVFFISLGVLLDIHSITPALLVFVVALTAGAIVTKVIGSGLPARIFKYDNIESFIIGVGMVPRGEVAMIVALIGLSNKWINQDLYAAIVLMSLITTIVPPLVLRPWLNKIR